MRYVWGTRYTSIQYWTMHTPSASLVPSRYRAPSPPSSLALLWHAVRTHIKHASKESINLWDRSRSAVQGFFSFRIYTLSKRLYIPILSWTMSLMRLAAHTVMGVEAVRMTSWASYEAQWRPLLTAIWIVSAANDVLITTTLVYLLYCQRSHVHKRYLFQVIRCIIMLLSLLQNCSRHG
jgi:hypothetical protein